MMFNDVQCFVQSMPVAAALAGADLLPGGLDLPGNLRDLRPVTCPRDPRCPRDTDKSTDRIPLSTSAMSHVNTKMKPFQHSKRTAQPLTSIRMRRYEILRDIERHE